MSEIKPLEVAPGAWLRAGYLNAAAQTDMLHALREVIAAAPLFAPTMPRTGKAFSVRMTNCGPLGWVSDRAGYRYQALHPDTGQPWPAAIPDPIARVWRNVLPDAPAPEACLVNHYAPGARMGLHQDRDERADTPVLSISLGDSALFRIGGASRDAPTRSFKLRSGDVLTFGGPSRLAFHGIDRIEGGASGLLAEGGRFNLTLRRVNPEP